LTTCSSGQFLNLKDWGSNPPPFKTFVMKIKIIETGKIVEKSEFVARLFVRKGKAKFVKEVVKEDKTDFDTKEEKIVHRTKKK
jgi:hypothetical protein